MNNKEKTKNEKTIVNIWKQVIPQIKKQSKLSAKNRIRIDRTNKLNRFRDLGFELFGYTKDLNEQVEYALENIEDWIEKEVTRL